MSYSTTIHDQAANLYAQAQDGDAESLEELMRMHEGLVHHIVRQQWRGRLSYEQAIHAGRIGLWHAVLGFDPGRGYAFSTYASVAIARRVWRAVRCAEREPDAALAPVSPPSSVDPRAEVQAGEIQAALYALVARLPALQRWADCLNPLYDARVIPVIVIRHNKQDQDPQIRKLCGYDKNGHPLCAHGYPMSFNGIDYSRLRACWVCHQICTQRRPQLLFAAPDRPLH